MPAITDTDARPLLPPQNEETYLGDGLYASFDGYHINLRAPRIGGDHVVGLEPDVYHAMTAWVARYSALWEHFAIRNGRKMMWRYSHRADTRSRLIADRHYNRQKIGTPQFMPPGRCVVFYAGTETGEAFWGTSWPFAEYVKHAWGGAWICSAFRNEGTGCASVLIRQAVSATRALMGEPPELGMITFVDRKKVRPTKVRGKPVWGWTYRKAGFVDAGETKGGLLALQLWPDAMPDAEFPITELEAAIGSSRG